MNALSSALQSAGIRNTLNHKGIVLPFKPPIDKLAAAAIAEMYNPEAFASVEYWMRNDVPEGMLAHWAERRILTIDIGADKYHVAKVASATELIVKRYSIQLTDGGKKVLEMINRNNKTGNLKGNYMAIPHLLREMYELNDFEAHHLKVVAHAMYVVNTLIRAFDLKERRGFDDMPPQLAQMRENLKRCNDAPFTVGRLLRDMWQLGASEVDIVHHVAFWIDGFAQLVQERKRGEREFEQLEGAGLENFKAGKFTGIVLRTDDRFIAKAAAKAKEHDQEKYGVRVVVNSDGHISVITYGRNISAFAAELARIEPGRWYHQPKTGCVLNGSVQYKEVPPTALKPSQLIAMLEKHPPTHQGQQ